MCILGNLAKNINITNNIRIVLQIASERED